MGWFWLVAAIAQADFPPDVIEWELRDDLEGVNFDLDARMAEAFAAWTSDSCADVVVRRVSENDGAAPYRTISIGGDPGDTLAPGVILAVVNYPPQAISPRILRANLFVASQTFAETPGCTGERFERQLAGRIAGAGLPIARCDWGDSTCGSGWRGFIGCGDERPTQADLLALQVGLGRHVTPDLSAFQGIIAPDFPVCVSAYSARAGGDSAATPPPTWDFGDGTVRSGWEVCHTYTASGLWPVVMRHTRSDGSCPIEEQTWASVGPSLTAEDAGENEGSGPGFGCVAAPGAAAGWAGLVALFGAVRRRPRSLPRGV